MKVVSAYLLVRAARASRVAARGERRAKIAASPACIAALCRRRCLLTPPCAVQAVLGGKASPSAADVKAILASGARCGFSPQGPRPLIRAAAARLAGTAELAAYRAEESSWLGAWSRYAARAHRFGHGEMLRQQRTHSAGTALLVARLDNLGKGASGAAVQNLNLALGLAPDAGLA